MTMDVSSLPIEMWYHFLESLELSDLVNLFCVSRRLNELLENEATFEYWARAQFPSSTLDIAVYNNSWKHLVQDQNSKNGVYRRHMHVPSSWKNNGRHGHYQFNAVRCMTWDRQKKIVQVGIEAFGHGNMRDAAGTSVFKVNPTKMLVKVERLQSKMPLSELAPAPLPADGILAGNPLATRRAGFASGSHDSCLLDFDDSLFVDRGQFLFCYNGCGNLSGSDFPCVEFIRYTEFRSLRQWFDPRNPECDFLPRDEARLDPSNIMEWPLTLPKRIIELHRKGHWGAVGGRATADE